MNSYCTYFDRGYLPAGLALWESLRRHEPAGELTVLALDEDTADVLRARGEPGLRVLPLADLLAADPELAAAQATRSRREFIFTLTPCLVRHLLRAPGAGPVMYLDADLYFFGSPEVIRREWGRGSIYIVPHRYPPWHDDAAHYGRFNVGVLGFRPDAAGLACVEWWRTRCLESCALTTDGIHYGDQKYLDEWPGKFAGVVESAHPGVNLAPWNWAGLHCEAVGSALAVAGEPLIVFHFAQFRPLDASWCDSGQLEYGIMPRALRSVVYGPYWVALDRATAWLAQVRPGLVTRPAGWRAFLQPWHIGVLRLFWGQCWRRGGASLWSWRLGLGRFSGHFMGLYRRWRA